LKVLKLLYRNGARDEQSYDSDGFVSAQLFKFKGALHLACQNGHVPVIEFLLDNNADINKRDNQQMTPLHLAIYKNQLPACKLILGYEQVSSQSIESGITMSRIAKSPEIQALLEKELKSRRKVILVCFFYFDTHPRALLTLNSLKRSAASANKSLSIVKSVASVRSQCIAAGYEAAESSNCSLGLSDAALEDPQDILLR
jgi:ankyrin repeat protein